MAQLYIRDRCEGGVEIMVRSARNKSRWFKTTFCRAAANDITVAVFTRLVGAMEMTEVEIDAE